MEGEENSMPVRQPSDPMVFPQDSPQDEDTQQGDSPVLNGISDPQGHSCTTAGISTNGDLHNSTTHERSSREAEGADPPLSPCVMTVIVQPPPNIRPGEQFDSPMVVSLESRPSRNRRHDIPENDARYWAIASITQDGVNILQGIFAVTIRRSDMPLQHLNLGYLIFNNLRILHPGNFKICISLVLMPDITGPSDPYTSVAGGIKVDEVLTNEIHVGEDAVMMPRRMPSNQNLYS